MLCPSLVSRGASLCVWDITFQILITFNKDVASIRFCIIPALAILYPILYSRITNGWESHFNQSIVNVFQGVKVLIHFTKLLGHFQNNPTNRRL
jgi:hypothetical protein